MINLIFAFVWALTGAIATKYYAKNYEEYTFNPLPAYIAFCFIIAGVQLAKFVS